MTAIYFHSFSIPTTLHSYSNAIASLPYSFFHSIRRRYHIGQTGYLFTNPNKGSWGALLNPANSRVCIRTLLIAITNFSTYASLHASISFNAYPSGHKLLSPHIATLRSINPIRPYASVLYNPTGNLTIGQSHLEETVFPYTISASITETPLTLMPGEIITIYLRNHTSSSRSQISFGWYEEALPTYSR
ncbi:hypothetical protein IC619_002005 [Hazenella sp. IB182353]|uniref:DUF6143 family protein n=1 Tax=Polycladospora coralii TaxID=2771432 RepID=UPI001746FC3A|nr:hypothetical protein [Polycladospora coralii]